MRRYETYIATNLIIKKSLMMLLVASFARFLFRFGKNNIF
jgi:hypothetical protein